MGWQVIATGWLRPRTPALIVIWSENPHLRQQRRVEKFELAGAPNPHRSLSPEGKLAAKGNMTHICSGCRTKGGGGSDLAHAALKHRQWQ